MRLQTKIYILLALILMGTLACFSYPIIKKKYFENNESEVIQIENEQTNDSPNETSLPSDEIPVEDTENINPPEEDVSTAGESFVEISRERCEADCAGLENDLEKFSYCQQVCGLSPTPVQDGDGCEKLTGLEKDYCLKDLGISKLDFSLCEKISDGNIKTTCISRITEGFVDREIPLE